MATEGTIQATPTDVQVGPYRYGIGYDGESANDFCYHGICLFQSRRLKLDPGQADTEIPQTLLHEILHAIGDAYEIDDWRKHKFDPDGKTIDKIDLMASGLLQFLRSNPEIVRFLTESR
jgi:hypothetical protein